MESYSELPLFGAPSYVSTSDGKQIQAKAASLNYAMDSFDATNRSAPYLPISVQPIRHSDEFHDTLRDYLSETHEAVLRTAPPAACHANLLRHLRELEAQRDILSRALVYTKLQKRRGPAGGMVLIDAGAPGKAVHDGAWKLFEESIAKTKAALDKSPVTEARRQELDQKRRRRFAIAALALGGVALVGLLVALSLYLANQPAEQPPLPLPRAYPPHHRRLAPQPPSLPPPPIGPQPAINPILLGYNPNIQEYLSIQTPFSPSPLYSYPA
jgi:hypothetical protein